MTDELKTLKDIYHKSENAEGFIEQYKHILRQEAIKWMKEMESYRYANKTPKGIFEKIIENEDLTCSDLNHLDQAIIWIQHFFNITEEDLSNG